MELISPKAPADLVNGIGRGALWAVTRHRCRPA